MIVLSVTSVILSSICLIRLYGSKIINFYSFGYINILTLLIGSLVWDDINGVENSTATVLAVSALLVYSAGPVVGRLIGTLLPRHDKNKWLSIPTVPTGLVSKLALWSCIVISFTILAFHFYKAGLAITAEDVNYAKVESFTKGGFIYLRFLRVMLPLLLIQYIVILFLEQKRGWSPLLIVLVLISAVLSFATGFKGYFFYFFLVPFLIVYANHGQLSLKYLCVIFLLSLLLVSFYAAFVEGTNFIGGVAFVLARLTLGNAEGVYYLINTITPDNGSYFYGETFLWDIARFFSKLGLYDYEGENLAAYTFTLLKKGDNPQHMQAVTSIVGELYANFGPVVMLIFVALYSSVLDWYTRISSTMKVDVFVYPFIVLSGVHAGNLFVTGPILYNTMDLILSLGLMGTIYLFIWILLSLPTGQIKLSRRKIRVV